MIETIRALADERSIDEIVEDIKFLAAVQKGLDQLDKGKSIPHEEIRSLEVGSNANRALPRFEI